jgi:hypothetical protein
MRARRARQSTTPRNPDRDPTRAEASDRETYIRRGQDAWKRHKADATWTDWLAIAEALDIGRAEVMVAAGTNKPEGSAYNKRFGDWLKQYGFDDIDKGDRSRLFDILKNRPAIEEWRATLPRSDRLRTNAPSTVWRKWQASLKPTPEGGRTNQTSQQSQLSKAKAENEQLRAHVAELEAAREAAASGPKIWHDLYDPIVMFLKAMEPYKRADALDDLNRYILMSGVKVPTGAPPKGKKAKAEIKKIGSALAAHSKEKATTVAVKAPKGKKATPAPELEWERVDGGWDSEPAGYRITEEKKGGRYLLDHEGVRLGDYSTLDGPFGAMPDALDHYRSKRRS